MIDIDWLSRALFPVAIEALLAPRCHQASSSTSGCLWLAADPLTFEGKTGCDPRHYHSLWASASDETAT